MIPRLLEYSYTPQNVVFSDHIREFSSSARCSRLTKPPQGSGHTKGQAEQLSHADILFKSRQADGAIRRELRKKEEDKQRV